MLYEIDPIVLGALIALTTGVTQMVKQAFKIETSLFVWLIAVGVYTAGAMIFYVLPPEAQAHFIVVATGISLPGNVGLVMQIAGPKEEMKVHVLDEQK